MLILFPLILIFTLIFLIFHNIFIVRKKKIQKDDNKQAKEEIQKLIAYYEELLNQTNTEIKNNKKTIALLQRKINSKLKQW